MAHLSLDQNSEAAAVGPKVERVALPKVVALAAAGMVAVAVAAAGMVAVAVAGIAAGVGAGILEEVAGKAVARASAWEPAGDRPGKLSARRAGQE